MQPLCVLDITLGLVLGLAILGVLLVRSPQRQVVPEQLGSCLIDENLE